jgi:hypothetical protein
MTHVSVPGLKTETSPCRIVVAEPDPCVVPKVKEDNRPMHIPDPYVYAIVASVVSSIAVLTASVIAFRASRKAAKTTMEGVERHIDFQKREKIADLQQAWINELRNQMATFQSLGVTPDLQQQSIQEFYKAGTMLELLLNRKDPRYQELQGCLYKYLAAKTTQEKYECNAPFVEVCQDILETEWEVLKKDLLRREPSAPA